LADLTLGRTTRNSAPTLVQINEALRQQFEERGMTNMQLRK